MQQPVIHFDVAMGVYPRWRDAITAGLQGQEVQLQREYLRLSGLSPAGARMLAASFRYAQFGQQVFCAGPVMRDMMFNTPVGRIPRGLVRFPYDCFYVALPDCDWQSAESLHDMALQCDRDPASVSTSAANLRAEGIKLKRFQRWGEVIP